VIIYLLTAPKILRVYTTVPFGKKYLPIGKGLSKRFLTEAILLPQKPATSNTIDSCRHFFNT
jgi:hypothetical protein